jgi:hypothetical protein
MRKAGIVSARYVRPYSNGQKNDFRDAEAIAEAVQRPTMKFVATKTAEQLDLQALHRVRERLVGQRTGAATPASATGQKRLYAAQQKTPYDLNFLGPLGLYDCCATCA